MDSKLLRGKEPFTIPMYFVQCQTKHTNFNAQMADNLDLVIITTTIFYEGPVMFQALNNKNNSDNAHYN